MAPRIRLALGATCIAFAPILVKCVELGPTPIGFYRCAIGAVFLFAWSARRRPSRSHDSANRSLFPARALWWSCALAAVLFAADLAVWHRSVIWVGAGLSTILGNTQVFYLGLIGLLWHRERLTVRYAASVPLAFGGISLLVGLGAAENTSEHHALGVALGLCTGVIYASFLLVLRRMESRHPESRTEQNLAPAILGAALLLGGLSGLEGTFVIPTIADVPWLLLLGLGPQVVGWVLISGSLPHVPVSQSGLILLLQPVLATVLGAAIFREHLTGWQWLGAVVTFVAIYLGTTRKLSS